MNSMESDFPRILWPLTINVIPIVQSTHRALSIYNSSNDLVSATGEFFGTCIFLLVGLGGIQAAATSNLYSLAQAEMKTNNTASDGTTGASAINTVASLEQLTYISASMGLGLLFSAWIFYRATGAAFNPNVSFALLLIGVVSPTRFILYAIAQFVGAIVASALLAGLLPGPLAVTPALGAGTNLAQGVFIECFTTCALILSVLFLAVEKHRATFLAPVGIGITLFAGHLFATVYTGASMNTARAFGPAVITGFGSDHWVGPTLGSFLAVAIYAIMKRFKYWKLSEGQDTDESKKRGPSARIIPSISQTLQHEKDGGVVVGSSPEGLSGQRESQSLTARKLTGTDQMV
ncbi:aquaporin-like protein [Melampsora americana]|nr:aquaporin-like protein [Melampsora americana]